MQFLIIFSLVFGAAVAQMPPQQQVSMTVVSFESPDEPINGQVRICGGMEASLRYSTSSPQSYTWCQMYNMYHQKSVNATTPMTIQSDFPSNNFTVYSEDPQTYEAADSVVIELHNKLSSTYQIYRAGTFESISELKRLLEQNETVKMPVACQQTGTVRGSVTLKRA